MKKYLLLLISCYNVLLIAQSHKKQTDNCNYLPHQLAQPCFEKIDYSQGKIYKFLKDAFGATTEEEVLEIEDKNHLYTQRFLEFKREYEPYYSYGKELPNNIKEKWKGVYNKILKEQDLYLSPDCVVRYPMNSVRPYVMKEKKYKYYYQALISIDYVCFNQHDIKKEQPFIGTCYLVVSIVQIGGNYFIDRLLNYGENIPDDF